MMMKTLFLAMGAFMISSGAYAADSVMMLHFDGKLTILIDEVGQDGKLAKLFHAFVSEPDLNQFDWSTNGDFSSDVTVVCNRGVNADPTSVPYFCTFTFAPSANVQITDHSMSAKVGKQDSTVRADVTFENASGETFSFKMMSKGLTASATQN